MRRFLVSAAAAASALALVSGCATGTDAVATGGTFDFVSPGGQTDIFYDPPSDRGAVGELSGPDLMDEGATTSLSDFEGEAVVLNVWGQWCGPCRGEADDLEDRNEADAVGDHDETEEGEDQGRPHIHELRSDVG